MDSGDILKAARRDHQSLVTAGVVLVLLCGGVVALNWKYVYNFATGPYPFSKALADAPGSREFVRAEGPMLTTGAAETTTFRLLPRRGVAGAVAAASKRSLAESESVSARYMVMAVDSGFLVAKVPPEFAGRVVEGRLVPLPNELRDSSEGASLYPWMIDAKTEYRWDFNLFIMIAAPALPLALMLLISALRQARDITRHLSLARIAKHGAPLALVPQIERELTTAPNRAHIGPLWLGPNWIVALSPSLFITAVSDLVGAGLTTRSKTSGGKTTVTHAFTFWMRGETLTREIDVTESEGRAILEHLLAQHPWVVVEDVAVFGKRWSRDAVGCERDADMRRAAARRAARSASEAPNLPGPAPVQTPA